MAQSLANANALDRFATQSDSSCLALVEQIVELYAISCPCTDCPCPRRGQIVDLFGYNSTICILSMLSTCTCKKICKHVVYTLIVCKTSCTPIYKKNYLFLFIMPITESEIFIALFAALLTGILAARLGIELARPATR